MNAVFSHQKCRRKWEGFTSLKKCDTEAEVMVTHKPDTTQLTKNDVRECGVKVQLGESLKGSLKQFKKKLEAERKIFKPSHIRIISTNTAAADKIQEGFVPEARPLPSNNTLPADLSKRAEGKMGEISGGYKKK